MHTTIGEIPDSAPRRLLVKVTRSDGYRYFEAMRESELNRRVLSHIDYVGWDFKNFAHVEARMEVWRKGYCLYCDVNGVLYVYFAKKEKKVKNSSVRG